MRIRFVSVVAVLFWLCPMFTGVAWAGFDEGVAAYKKGNYATALKEFKVLANQGDASAQVILGTMYDYGEGVPQDYKEAAKWYRLAADQGYADAQYNLGAMYESGQGAPQDYKEAVKWYRLAADQGNADAQNCLGSMYFYGEGVPQDYKEAMKWYRFAADQGSIDAQRNLGLMYARGQGVPQDPKEAVKWFRLAADQGSADAQNSLGLRYDRGQGVPQDYKEAVKWYRLAADQGNASAQNNLGLMYESGSGVGSSRVVAYALFNVSAAGDPSKENKGTENRDRIVKDLSGPEIELGQSLTREMAKPGNLLKVLDRYLKKPAAAEKAKPVSTAAARSLAPAPGDGYPAQPEKRPGVTTCNTNCSNGDCRRTYDDGRKVRFQAKQKFDALSNEWKFDSGSC